MIKIPAAKHAATVLLLAVIFWTIIFALKPVNFWLGMVSGIVILVILSTYWGGMPFSYKKDVSLRNTLIGVASVVPLYLIFAAVKLISDAFIPAASDQIASIYLVRNEAPVWLITVILLFITSPGEELLWRGFFQRWASAKWGKEKGMLLAVLPYSCVHIVSANIMLVGAALAGGLYWGYMYMKTDNIYVCTVSHAVFTVGAFLLLPLG